ncbi:MAG TPA: pyruvate ferredoxin oxidoreductase [Candidatus Polarisedimenticolia bacterium]|nr:pyruvate ferredoxin oxidoreductase [Candidatus Polarisedimenticolia bacterium]
MRKVLMGNHAVSHGVALSRAEVISAYPITPQTQIVEELSEMCADGRLAARFIKVESEHSAMAACIGASAAGARAFTATSSQGLALMHELLHWAALGRLPVVMAEINRALAPGWSIWTDQNDSLSQRDTGWIQLYCETNQEVLDTTIQSFRLAEQVDLPVMLVLDAFYLSHTSEPVDIPDAPLVDAFLPRREARRRLDVSDPHAFGGLTRPDVYMEMRLRQQEAMDEARRAADAIDRLWLEATGRTWPAVESYRAEGAELLLATSGTITSTARYVVDAMRAAGVPAGLVKIRMFRPFPTAPLREALAGAGRVAVLDRNISPGHGGIFAEEIRSCLYDLDPSRRPELYGYILGLGGRDVTPETITHIVEQTLRAGAPDRTDTWVGVTA